MPSPSSSNDHLDFRFATSIGNSYFALARPLLDRMATGLNEGPRAAIDSGTVFSTATNVALALELYLKAIRIGLKLSVQDTHNLWALYKSLPVDVKATLEGAYDEKLAAKAPTEIFELEICIQRGGEPSDSFEFPRHEQRSNDLPNLMKRSASMFVAWRYVYESVPPNQKYVFFSFEHSRLRAACEVLLEFLQRGEREANLKEVGGHAA